MPPVAVAVTLFIDGDDEVLLLAPVVPPVAVAVTLFIDGDDEVLYTP